MRFMIVQNCRYALNGITVVDFNKDQDLDGYDINLCNRLVELGLAKRVDNEKKDSTSENNVKDESKNADEQQEIVKKPRARSKKVTK